MKTIQPAPAHMTEKTKTAEEVFEHKDAPPIAPSPKNELEASRLAENVANTENAAELERERLAHGAPVVNANTPNDPGGPQNRVSPELAPSMLPTNQAPVVHGGPGVRHIPGTEIVVGGPTQQ